MLCEKGVSCGWPGSWPHHGVWECAWGRCDAGAELGGGARGSGFAHFLTTDLVYGFFVRIAVDHKYPYPCYIEPI
eukprot:1124777-Prymnesium_polylepis.1